MPPDPARCKRLRRLGKIYSCAYIFKIPRYAPVGVYENVKLWDNTLELTSKNEFSDQNWALELLLYCLTSFQWCSNLKIINNKSGFRCIFLFVMVEQCQQEQSDKAYPMMFSLMFQQNNESIMRWNGISKSRLSSFTELMKGVNRRTAFWNYFAWILDSKQDFNRFPHPAVTADCRFIHFLGRDFGFCV